MINASSLQVWDYCGQSTLVKAFTRRCGKRTADGKQTLFLPAEAKSKDQKSRASAPPQQRVGNKPSTFLCQQAVYTIKLTVDDLMEHIKVRGVLVERTTLRLKLTSLLYPFTPWHKICHKLQMSAFTSEDEIARNGFSGWAWCRLSVTWHSTWERNSLERASQILCRCVSLRQRRFTWQRKCLRFRTHAHSNTPRGGCGGLCEANTCDVMPGCRGLSGTRGTESGETSMVTRLVHTESTVSSVSVKQRRTLTECLRTNVSVCRGQPHRSRWGRLMTQVKHRDVPLIRLSGSLILISKFLRDDITGILRRSASRTLSRLFPLSWFFSDRLLPESVLMREPRESAWRTELMLGVDDVWGDAVRQTKVLE